MSDNDLRDRIAKAISRAHEAWWNDEDNFLDMPGYEAQAVIDDLGLTIVYAPAWDGEPSMSGRPHRMSVGTEQPHRENVENLLDAWKNRGDKPGLRIESRVVGRWVEQ